MIIPLGSLSPADAISTALHSAPTPIAVRRNPCPVDPTAKMSRAKTGKSVVKGTMNNSTNITVRRPARTASFRQLNFHPSMMLWPNDSLQAAGTDFKSVPVAEERCCRAKLDSPNCRQEVKNSLHGVCTAGTEHGNEHTG